MENKAVVKKIAPQPENKMGWQQRVYVHSQTYYEDLRRAPAVRVFEGSAFGDVYLVERDDRIDPNSIGMSTAQRQSLAQNSAANIQPVSAEELARFEPLSAVYVSASSLQLAHIETSAFIGSVIRDGQFVWLPKHTTMMVRLRLSPAAPAPGQNVQTGRVTPATRWWFSPSQESSADSKLSSASVSTPASATARVETSVSDSSVAASPTLPAAPPLSSAPVAPVSAVATAAPAPTCGTCGTCGTTIHCIQAK
jgi:hypothetical protein